MKIDYNLAFFIILNELTNRFLYKKMVLRNIQHINIIFNNKVSTR